MSVTTAPPSAWPGSTPDEWPGTYQQAAGAWWTAREAWEAQTGRVPFLALDPIPPDVTFDPVSL